MAAECRLAEVGADRAAECRVVAAAPVVAEAEGLTAHRRAVEIRFEDQG